MAPEINVYCYSPSYGEVVLLKIVVCYALSAIHVIQTNRATVVLLIYRFIRTPICIEVSNAEVFFITIFDMLFSYTPYLPS